MGLQVPSHDTDQINALGTQYSTQAYSGENRDYGQMIINLGQGLHLP